MLNCKFIIKLFVFFFYRFIAERGEGGQLLHVEKIDDFFKLKPLPVIMESSRPVGVVAIQRPLAIPSNTPRYVILQFYFTC